MTLPRVLLVNALGLCSLSAASFSYRADLVPDAVVVEETQDNPTGVSASSASALLTLTTGESGGPTLTYELVFNGLAVSETIPRPVLSGPDNLIRGIHLHLGALGINGPHVLNVYGFPFEYDDDLVVEESSSRVSGIWDDGDENLGPDGIRTVGDSIALSAALSDLQAGNLYFQIHTMGFRAGELRGQILPVPEPHTATLILLGSYSFFLKRQMRGGGMNFALKAED